MPKAEALLWRKAMTARSSCAGRVSMSCTSSRPAAGGFASGALIPDRFDDVHRLQIRRNVIARRRLVVNKTVTATGPARQVRHNGTHHEIHRGRVIQVL